jgi:DNA-binding transcriptional ArsR family regulator
MRKRPHPSLGLGPEALSLVAARFRALGEPSRLRILSHLLTGELSVQELVDATGLTQTATSRQLAVLRAERIVARRAEGRNAIYRVVDTTIVDICHLVCGGLERRLTDDLRVMVPSGRRPAARNSGATRRRGP